jgi:carbon-monoxide dehydrogenase large subunit
MEIRVDPNGAVALHVGTVASGQGHETMFAQMVSDWLGVPLADVHVFQGDTDKILFGRGTFAQRSMMTGGSALKEAAAEVVRKGRRMAAWMMDAPESEVDFAAGVFRVRGGNMSVGFAEVARRSYQGIGLPEAFGVGLDGTGTHSGDCSFPAGCMICEVEVDPATGDIRIDRLCAVDDVGVVINPLTLEGQLHGSIAQGLGQALVEEVLYEPGSGQLLSGSFLDYGMPRADIMPPIRSGLDLVPAKTNPLGVKGGSEAGNVAAPPALVNAVIDALSPWGVTDLPLPATPERVWRAISARRGG